MAEQTTPPPGGEILLYQAEDGRTRIECRFQDETLWLTQAQLAALFQTTPQNITTHLKAIYAEGELSEQATCKAYLQVRQEGTREVTRSLRYYSLEAILSVGYRVRSPRGTAFRQWATARLGEYMLKAFVMERVVVPCGHVIPANAGIEAPQAMSKQPAVYILASKPNGTLYIGVTSDLIKRVWQHQHDAVEDFTQKYRMHTLVYFEQYEDMLQAIQREKQLKRWNRSWKIELIQLDNPTWRDLWPDIL